MLGGVEEGAAAANIGDVPPAEMIDGGVVLVGAAERDGDSAQGVPTNPTTILYTSCWNE